MHYYEQRRLCDAVEVDYKQATVCMICVVGKGKQVEADLADVFPTLWPDDRDRGHLSASQFPFVHWAPAFNPESPIKLAVLPSVLLLHVCNSLRHTVLQRSCFVVTKACWAMGRKHVGCEGVEGVCGKI